MGGPTASSLAWSWLLEGDPPLQEGALLTGDLPMYRGNPQALGRRASWDGATPSHVPCTCCLHCGSSRYAGMRLLPAPPPRHLCPPVKCITAGLLGSHAASVLIPAEFPLPQELVLRRAYRSGAQCGRNAGHAGLAARQGGPHVLPGRRAGAAAAGVSGGSGLIVLLGAI